MVQLMNMLELSSQEAFLQEDVELLQDVSRAVPGSVSYQIRRIKKGQQWDHEDTGMMVYHVNPADPSENKLELRFCVSGNVYCREKSAACDQCKFSESNGCVEKMDSIDVLSFSFTPNYLQQFAKGHRSGNQLMDQVLTFSHPFGFSRTAPICSKTAGAIQSLLNHHYTDTRENIFINAQTQIILLYATDCMNGECEQTSGASKFLAHPDDRQKIIDAREILLQHIGNPITIKALSRKVAINECYLKKGFKEIFGTTIFDFYQSQRMEHAKYLLYEKRYSVTEVSSQLGYSSISHFSTAFKKHTGIKPCELLIH
jgi:AraC-like DNA-binding protein